MAPAFGRGSGLVRQHFSGARHSLTWLKSTRYRLSILAILVAVSCSSGRAQVSEIDALPSLPSEATLKFSEYWSLRSYRIFMLSRSDKLLVAVAKDSASLKCLSIPRFQGCLRFTDLRQHLGWLLRFAADSLTVHSRCFKMGKWRIYYWKTGGCFKFLANENCFLFKQAQTTLGSCQPYFYERSKAGLHLKPSASPLGPLRAPL